MCSVCCRHNIILISNCCKLCKVILTSVQLLLFINVAGEQCRLKWEVFHRWERTVRDGIV